MVHWGTCDAHWVKNVRKLSNKTPTIAPWPMLVNISFQEDLHYFIEICNTSDSGFNATPYSPL